MFENNNTLPDPLITLINLSINRMIIKIGPLEHGQLGIIAIICVICGTMIIQRGHTKSRLVVPIRS